MTIHHANNQEKHPKLEVPDIGGLRAHPLPCGFRRRCSAADYITTSPSSSAFMLLRNS